MLSIIIPSFNSSQLLEETLPLITNYLTLNFSCYEIIVVDDGSKDKEKTKEAAHKNSAIYLSYPKNIGKGAAVKKGILAAKGDCRIFLDADAPFQLKSIQNFYQHIIDKQCDIVIGDRSLPESDYFKHSPFLRRLTSRLYSFIVRTFFVKNFYDTQCGMKALSAEACLKIFSNIKIKGFAFDVELLTLALKKNMVIKRLPVNYREHPQSSIKILPHGFSLLLDLIRIKIQGI